jgi:hypothetical protein
MIHVLTSTVYMCVWFGFVNREKEGLKRLPNVVLLDLADNKITVLPTVSHQRLESTANTCHQDCNDRDLCTYCYCTLVHCIPTVLLLTLCICV